ncbi:MAG: site-2 protease family protein [Deltaproteobacteria bacterium]|nr:site-2 protease family protein [Deltaproteobacteria bacterium]
MSNLFWFTVLIGALIFAHEGGHFLFAKLFNVKVLTFSLGFGGPIRIGKFKLAFKRKETEYRIAWIPLGGFVRMAGDDPTEPIPPAEQDRAFLTQKAWKRFFIVLGGPLFSVLLAVPIYFTYNLLQATARAPEVGRVIPNSPADKAGFLPGDLLLQIDGKDVATWEEIDLGIQAGGGDAIKIAFARGDEQLERELTPVKELDATGLELFGERFDAGLRHSRQGNLLGVVPGSPAASGDVHSWDRILAIDGEPMPGWNDVERKLASLGHKAFVLTVMRAAEVPIGVVTFRAPAIFDRKIQPMAAEEAPPFSRVFGEAYTGLEPVDLYVLNLLDGMPAEKAGIRPGDKIVAMFGKPIFSWHEFSRNIVEHKGGSSIPVKVRKSDQVVELALTPTEIEETNEFKQIMRKQGMGVTYQANLRHGKTIPRPNRLTYALKASMTETWRAISMNILGFVRIFEGRVAPTEAIGGPIMIFTVAGKSAERGWGTFLNMMAFLSVLLGILNLLPIPLLDGGHILFILIEAVQRRPVSLQSRVVASYIGLALLVSLMAFAFYNDIHRYWTEITSVFT